MPLKDSTLTCEEKQKRNIVISGFMVLSQGKEVFYIPYEKVTDKDYRL